MEFVSLYFPAQHTVDEGHIQSAAHHVCQQVILPLLVAAGVEGRQRVKGHAFFGAQRPQDRIGDAWRVKDTMDVAAVHVSATAEGRHLLPAAPHVDLVALIGQAVQGGERPLHTADDALRLGLYLLAAEFGVHVQQPHAADLRDPGGLHLLGVGHGVPSIW